MAPGYTIIQDETWTFLDARGNPVNGRKLTFRLADGTILEIDVTHGAYQQTDTVKEMIEQQIAAHYAIMAL